MTAQLDFFSRAHDCMDEVEAATVDLNFDRALFYLREAFDVDPYTPNLQSTFDIIEYFKDFFSQTTQLTHFIVSSWEHIPGSVEKKLFQNRHARIADEYVAKMAFKNMEIKSPFVDEKNKLHWGCLWAAIGKHQQAKKALLQSIGEKHQHRADLWAYYANSCLALRQEDEAQAAYARAFALNPDDIDYFRLADNNIKEIYEKMFRIYPEQHVKPLMLFQLWFSEFLLIPKISGPFEKNILEKEKHLKVGKNNQVENIYHFSLCFFLAEALDKNRGLIYREKMQQIDQELFNKYMFKKKQLEKS